MAPRIPPQSPRADGGRTSKIIGKNIVKVKEEDGAARVLIAGQPDFTRCDNTLITSRYTILNFLFNNIRFQFRRFANMYFLIVGGIMYVGENYPELYTSAFSATTTWGPVGLFVGISIIMEGIADKKRHVSDYKTNNSRCIVVENATADTSPVQDSMASSMNVKFENASFKNRRSSVIADEMAQNEIPCDAMDISLYNDDGTDTAAFFHPISRKDIRQGHIVVVKNREMIPADIVLLASSGDQGCAYIETSSIDGETNLKLRLSAKHKTDPSFHKAIETIEEAVRRIATFTAIGCPNGESPDNRGSNNIAKLETAAPDAHINTFNGLLKLPRLETIDEEDASSRKMNTNRNVPLGADHLLLRGSVLRNTAWAIGIACYTGTDTKLSQNTIEAPQKFSQLDKISNKLVIWMILVELACIIYLSTMAVVYNRRLINELWYIGIKPKDDQDGPWPYLPNLPAPKWETSAQNWLQFSLTNITLLSYFVPLSMYITLEFCNFFLVWTITVDEDIYDATTDTRAEPHSNIYTDLGQIQYIFSDKTGTLTQNVMRFKRCSVDGMVFGRPVNKENPNAESGEKKQSSFLPLRQVLVGQVHVAEDKAHLETKKGMTFNAELFSRVMALCHTVVVEKDLDLPKENDVANGEGDDSAKSPDGAPIGYAYQAESPDEGALVSASSTTFGIQVINRDSSGIKLKCEHPTLFRDKKLVEELKSGKVDPSIVAAESVSGSRVFDSNVRNADDKIETWSVLAVNKFDSTRKRMSILLRSPPEFGSCAVLLCKGADTAMLDPEVTASSQKLHRGGNEQEGGSEWEMANMLGVETHLGEFATEGLRTLVLGVRFLTDEQCNEWLAEHTAAATAIKDRGEKLTKAAFNIERQLHIVGATAIEDKLQVGVPNTISRLGKAGVKLWVLTGDKRETAIEIGYATKVLTQRMHVTEMSDRGEDFVRAQCAMEFMRLVKAGKLPAYQRAAVEQQEKAFSFLKQFFSCLGMLVPSFFRSFKFMMLKLSVFIRARLGLKKLAQLTAIENMKATAKAEKEETTALSRRRCVRNRAEEIIREYSKLHLPISNNQPELSSDALPPVFEHAQSAQETLDSSRSQGKLTAVDERAFRLSQLTAQEVFETPDTPTIEDDLLSLQSFMPSDSDKANTNFDKKKRKFLERMFAVDRDVRKGRLVKHLKKEKRIQALSSVSTPHAIVPSGDGPRALVLEGAALKHLQGDHELEELVFNVASQCKSVIACRVTPRQKAQLVNLVRHHVEPEPVTLAIGDGANDVGMIHAAHVGIGISGKEGQQAVNASDFSIGQFRFLEDLILYHGRWDFMRTTMVVMFTFYKNAVIAGILVVYNTQTLFSGTSMFDQWLMAGFSFAAFCPILFLGIFDRNLEKSYVKKNPEVYKSTQLNEMITPRTLFRWLFITLSHVAILYFGHLYPLTRGGASTSSFKGLMWNKGSVGDGEVSDWQSLGTTMFMSMILLLGYKVIYESRSIINGDFPAFLGCFKKTKGEFVSRIAFTWIGLFYGSYGFCIVCLTYYNYFGQVVGASWRSWFPMTSVPAHVFSNCSSNYALMLCIPFGAIAFDVFGKVFSNMFYPSQNQIHIELEAKEIRQQRKLKNQGGSI